MTLTTTQRSIIITLTAILLVSLSVAAWAVAKWGFSRSSRPDTTRGITVSDSAQVKTSPDTAFVTFGVVIKHKDSKRAARLNAERTSAVIVAMAKAGISKRDIKTVDYSLQPSINYDKNPPRVVGYEASNSVRVRTKDLAKLGALIDMAISSGANSVQDTSFDVEDKRAFRRKAIGLAVAKAHGKAQAIAEALGGRLGPAISASESVDMYVPDSRNAVMEVSPSRARMRLATPVSPGESTVSAQVRIVYSIQ